MDVFANPTMKLYTNHHCPWAYRAHIALAELKLDYDEEIIDLYTTRTPEYLQVNPRGLVPALDYNGAVVTESAVVATFLADAFPSQLWPASTDPDGPLVRSQINFFVDTYFSKAQGHWASVLSAKTEAEEIKAGAAYVDTIASEIDCLLVDAEPFFGGSSTLTLAEVLIGSWLLRVYSLPEHGVVSRTILDNLATQAPNFDKWAKAVIAHPSVRCVWDEEKMVEATKLWMAKMKASK